MNKIDPEIYNIPIHLHKLYSEATLEDLRRWSDDFNKMLLGVKAKRIYYKALRRDKLELAKRIKAKYITGNYSPYNSDLAIASAMALVAANKPKEDGNSN